MMNVFATFLVVTTAVFQSCKAADENIQLQRRDQYQPGFGNESSSEVPLGPLPEPENQEDWDHVPFQSRIVGGEVASAANYPFSVYLGGCGGSLIHEDIVLTAAHCHPLYPEFARVGGGTKIGGDRRSIVGTGTRHPRYSSRSQDYDFMVYKLSSPVTEKTPVILNNDFNTPSDRETLTVLGFGSTYEGGPGSFYLREVNINHVPHTNCNFAYRGQITESSMFCAGVDGGGQDSCQGDSGGPIIDQDGAQVGVTSWGNGCAQRGFPGVYARVSAAYDWIQEQICSMSDNPPASCSDNVNEPNTGDDGDNGNDGNPDTDSDNDSDNNNDSDNDNDNDNDNDSDNNTDTDSDMDDSDMIQPKGLSLRIDINYDEYPQENAWVFYNDDTKEEIYWSGYGEVATAGLHSKTFTNLTPGKYVFLLLDEFWDGICCKYGNGYIKIFEVFPTESARDDELRWSHNGRFWNVAGASFQIMDEDDRRALAVADVDVDGGKLGDSPYLH